MLKELHLTNFKNFEQATLKLGQMTLLLGSNASGKSNLREAFRFLHGIGRGYALADIIGTKYGEGGDLQWRGIRGGFAELSYQKNKIVTMEARLRPSFANTDLVYHIEIEAGFPSVGRARVVRESLYDGDEMYFDSHPKQSAPEQEDSQSLMVRIKPGGKFRKGHVERFSTAQPVLSQMKSVLEKKRTDASAEQVSIATEWLIGSFASMRFLDLSPDAMRQPSFPGQVVLGDRGENLSTVLQAICENPSTKRALTEWLRELTPMDASDFEFPTDLTGRTLLTLVEKNGQRISGYSASDGTLRFLAMVAALLGPESAKFYFIEEIENGIHPTRIHLLMELLEQKVKHSDIQVVATTHSPQLLRMSSQETRQAASLVYRLSERDHSQVVRLQDFPPEAQKILNEQDVARLYESGWFEDLVNFMEAENTK